MLSDLTGEEKHFQLQLNAVFHYQRQTVISTLYDGKNVLKANFLYKAGLVLHFTKNHYRSANNEPGTRCT